MVITYKCPICGRPLVEEGGADGNPYNKDRPSSLHCPNCGYTLNDAGYQVPLSLPNEEEPVSKFSSILIIADASGLGITRNLSYEEELHTVGIIDLTSKEYPLCNLGSLSYDEKFIYIRGLPYPKSQKNITLIESKPISTFDKMPAMEVDTYTIRFIKQEEKK